MKLEGTFTALITPFKNGKLDESALRRLIRHQRRNGITGLVPCGSTGEAATLHPEEYQRVVEIAKEEGRGCPVIPGIGTNSTEKTVGQAKLVEAMGADALLVLSPYYNKPTQQGLYEHFKAVANAVRVPVIVYNIPGRTAIWLKPETLARLAKSSKNILATKEATGSTDNVSEILRLCPAGFKVLSGDDPMTVPYLALGAHGVISVSSNIFPGEVSKMVAAGLRGDFKTAARLHRKLFPVFKGFFIETNPIPVKAAAHMGGIGDGIPRLPLTPLTAQGKKALKQALRQSGLKPRFGK